jgi:hypothetical protein
MVYNPISILKTRVTTDEPCFKLLSQDKQQEKKDRYLFYLKVGSK